MHKKYRLYYKTYSAGAQTLDLYIELSSFGLTIESSVQKITFPEDTISIWIRNWDNTTPDDLTEALIISTIMKGGYMELIRGC